jgi:hypothetical protein
VNIPTLNSGSSPSRRWSAHRESADEYSSIGLKPRPSVSFDADSDRHDKEGALPNPVRRRGIATRNPTRNRSTSGLGDIGVVMEGGMGE